MANEKRLDLISRSALLAELTDRQAFLIKEWGHRDHYTRGFVEAVDRVEKASIVDAVEVVHGRWIDNIDENGYLCNAWRKCSACGGLNWSKRPNYCPNCGADMRERKDNGKSKSAE